MFVLECLGVFLKLFGSGQMLFSNLNLISTICSLCFEWLAHQTAPLIYQKCQKKWFEIMHDPIETHAQLKLDL